MGISFIFIGFDWVYFGFGFCFVSLGWGVVMHFVNGKMPPRIKFLGSQGTKLDNIIYHNRDISVNYTNKQKGSDMQNVKFFDKNGVELKTGDYVVIEGSNKPREIKRFALQEFPSGFQFVKVYFVGHDTYANPSILTKHTPKLVKVKRTFEEVCELRDNGAMFMKTEKGTIMYKPVVSQNSGIIFIDSLTISGWKFKPKNSNSWQELDYKEVEE